VHVLVLRSISILIVILVISFLLFLHKSCNFMLRINILVHILLIDFLKFLLSTAEGVLFFNLSFVFWFIFVKSGIWPLWAFRSFFYCQINVLERSNSWRLIIGTVIFDNEKTATENFLDPTVNAFTTFSILLTSSWERSAIFMSTVVKSLSLRKIISLCFIEI